MDPSWESTETGRSPRFAASLQFASATEFSMANSHQQPTSARGLWIRQFLRKIFQIFLPRRCAVRHRWPILGNQATTKTSCGWKARLIEIHPGQMSNGILSRSTAWQKAINSARATQQMRAETYVLRAFKLKTS